MLVEPELCECGHAFVGAHQTPGTECAVYGCDCSRFRAAVAPEVTFEPSPARRGLDWLLETHPHLELVEANWQRPATPMDIGGPWLLVTLGQRSADGSDAFALYPFAIWKSTGAVHFTEPGGAVSDDPVFVP
jgi:hypothetical protein